MPITFSSFRSAAYSGLLRASGGGRRNCDGLLSTHGVMEANCGPAPGALANGVGRQAPTTATPTNGGGAGAIPSVSRHAQMASATVCPQAIPELIDSAVSFEDSAASEASRCAVRVVVCA